MSIFWRYKNNGGPWMTGWIMERKCGLIKIGHYNGDRYGVWVSESEIEKMERRP